MTHRHYIHAQLTFSAPRVISVLGDSWTIVGGKQLVININCWVWLPIFWENSWANQFWWARGLGQAGRLVGLVTGSEALVHSPWCPAAGLHSPSCTSQLPNRSCPAAGRLCQAPAWYQQHTNHYLVRRTTCNATWSRACPYYSPTFNQAPCWWSTYRYMCGKEKAGTIKHKFPRTGGQGAQGRRCGPWDNCCTRGNFMSLLIPPPVLPTTDIAQFQTIYAKFSNFVFVQERWLGFGTFASHIT